MKKKICMMMAALLALGMSVAAFGATTVDTSGMTPEELEWYEAYLEEEARAEEISREYRENPDTRTLLNELLDPNTYGGKYIKDDKIHIIPVDRPAVEQAVMSLSGRSRNASAADVVIDETPAKYTLQELDDAMERVSSRFLEGELDIMMVGTNEKDNTLEVWALEWTEEKKQEILELAGIENVTFLDYVIVYDPSQEDQYVVPSEKQEGPEMKAPVIGRAGSRIFDIDNVEGNAVMNATLGCTVVQADGSYGWISTGHSTGKRPIYLDDLFECEDAYTKQQVSMGVVIKNTWHDKKKNVDLLLIEHHPNRTETYLTKTSRYDLPITESELYPEPDNTVYILGQNGLTSAIVVNKGISMGWFDGYTYSNMIRMRLNNYDKPTSGDSGAAVCVKNEKGTGFIIVGIWKGIGSDGYGYATNWNGIQSAYDIDVY